MGRRWQDGVILLLGVWAIASPWAFSGALHHKPFGVAEAVRQNFWMVGVLLAAMASAVLSTLSMVIETGNGLAGAWLIVSPWVIGFSGSAPLMWNAVLTGSAVSLLAMLGLVKACQQVGVVRVSGP